MEGGPEVVEASRGRVFRVPSSPSGRPSNGGQVFAGPSVFDVDREQNSDSEPRLRNSRVHAFPAFDTDSTPP